jgi:hypothetical protein
MSEKSRIAVAGATGRAGRHVVDILESRDYDAVPISRTHGVEVITGEGLDEALTGVDAIIDVSTGPTPDEKEATEFFTTATRNLRRRVSRHSRRRSSRGRADGPCRGTSAVSANTELTTAAGGLPSGRSPKLLICRGISRKPRSAGSAQLSSPWLGPGMADTFVSERS